ncbi:pilus assembly protein [Oceanimonas pelagia]|uniref:Pilus assembly protein n=1 Tax=Oceanimonas pelagia TaxID=3028314 RepID=A0AA50KRS9_9GAMM|nr:TadE family protein [Oceanimonas pelagia]WMC11892.1 pilus assembly protein [Oceanimonas pelagia]
MMRLLLSGYASKQKGLAAVEATIVLPLMLLLMLAIGEFGRALYQYATLTQALRGGALSMDRMGTYVDNPTTRAEKENTVKNIIVYGNAAGSGNPVLQGLSKSNVTFSGIYELPVDSGNYYSDISISYSWQPIFGNEFNTFVAGSMSLDFPLNTSMTVRVK